MFKVNTEVHSPLYPLMQSYVREHDMSMGPSSTDRAMLRNLERYAVTVKWNSECITREFFYDWLQNLEVSDMSKVLYQNSLIRFSEYLNIIGHESYVGIRQHVKSDFVPYIYSKDEMSKLFAMADNWLDRDLRPDSIALVMPVLLRLLYSTAMRIGEALSIRNKDLDFNKHVVLLHNTKNGRDRYCALNPSMESVITRIIYVIAICYLSDQLQIVMHHCSAIELGEECARRR